MVHGQPAAGVRPHHPRGPQAEEKRALFLAAAASASDPDVVPHEIVKAIQATRPRPATL